MDSGRTDTNVDLVLARVFLESLGNTYHISTTPQRE